MTFKINSTQFNYQYNGRIHFPYSIATLVSYIKNNKELEKSFKFEKTFIFRNKLDEYIKQCNDTDILLCSCYIWNWEITTHFAREVKKINPNCLVIFGGPQTPNRSEGFFEEYPFIDIIVNNEGEIVLENILKTFLGDKNYLNVKGIKTKDFITDIQPRINDLDIIPSPYLNGLTEELIDRNESEKWAFSWETNRGCPYQCTFCDWGSATKTALRKFSEEKLFKEIEYFSEHSMPYIECCDANFGIFQERDMKIAKKLKETALTKNSPKFWQSAWAKFSSEKIIPIAKELQAGGLLTSVTLSVQSLDETTLDAIKRENMKFDSFTELSDTFRKNGIPTYSEIIRGLPGETLESFKKGLEVMITDTKISTIYIFNCGVYENAPMNEPHYKEFYKIKTIRSPIYLAHSSASNDRDIEEYENLIISTNSFTLDELKEMYLYSWMVLTFHGFGIFEYIEKYYHKIFDLPLIRFYEIFLEFCRCDKSIFSQEYQNVVKFMNDGYAGKGWNHYDSNLGDIFWPIEEASWIRLVSNSGNLQDAIHSFLTFLEEKEGYDTKNDILKELIRFQVFLITTKDNTENIKSENFEYDWKNFVNSGEINLGKKKYFYKNLVDEKDPIQWNYATIWYGRSTKQFKFLPEHLQEEEYTEELSQEMSKRKAFLSPY